MCISLTLASTTRTPLEQTQCEATVVFARDNFENYLGRIRDRRLNEFFTAIGLAGHQLGCLLLSAQQRV